MASLADEFLMDFESSEGEDEVDQETTAYTNDTTDANYYQNIGAIAISTPDLETLAKSRKKFIEPAPDNIALDEDELKELEQEEDMNLAFFNKIRRARTDKEGSAQSLVKARNNKGLDESTTNSSSESEYDSDDDVELDVNGRPKRKRRKLITKDDIEYVKLEKRLRMEKEIETYERLKQSNEFLKNPLEILREVQPGPSMIIPDKNNESEAYQVYLLKKDKKKIRFVLPEKQKTVYDYANLKLSSHYNNILDKLENTCLANESHAADGTYNLIIDANALLSDIDFEMIKIYNFARDLYTIRFPELETLLQNKLDYLKVAGVLLNELLNAKAMLTDVISDAQVMIVAMTATNTQGKKLSGAKLEVVKEACQLAENLAKDRYKIVKFVKSRMSLLAPNVTAIVGPNVAAQLIGKAADGLQGLARMPGCNCLLLGQEKSSQFSAHNKLPHTGYIYYSPLVQSIEPELRRKASRQVANKVILAARADANLTSRERREEPDLGILFRDQIYKKFELWEEPAKVKDIKALPKPLQHAGKKRRGGKRYRKMKERLGMTEVRKNANRTTFGEIEEDLNQEDLGISLGHLNQAAGSGLIRNLVEEKKSKVRMSKKMTSLLAKEAAASGNRTAISSGFRTVHKELGGGKSTVLGWGGTITSMGRRSTYRKGSASSVTFTPIQGLEIVNPEAVQSNEDGISSVSSYFAQPTLFKMPVVPDDKSSTPKLPRLMMGAPGSSSIVPGSASSIPGMRRNANGSVIPKW